MSTPTPEGMQDESGLTEQQAANLGFNVLDKPFHLPECCCEDCTAWRLARGRTLPDCTRPETIAAVRPAEPLIGVELIAAERQRQIEKEGWTAEHDAKHDRRELVRAAVIYLRFGDCWPSRILKDLAPHGWPWDASWWKPSDPIRNLVKAGALIAAEIDRLQKEKSKG